MTSKEIMVAFERQRRKQRITCKEVGTLAGVSDSTIYNYRAGRYLTTLDNLFAILSVVGLELVVKEKGEKK